MTKYGFEEGEIVLMIENLPAANCTVSTSY
jgi:hypothetical protein